MLKVDGKIPVYSWSEGTRRGEAGETGLWIEDSGDGELNLRYTSHKPQLCGEVYVSGTGFCPEPVGLNNWCDDVLADAVRRRADRESAEDRRGG